VIIDNETFYIDERTILVEDSFIAQQLAKFIEHLNLPIIALTEVTEDNNQRVDPCCPFRKYRTKATVGNLNNHIGVPLTLLSSSMQKQK
jgi:UDP-N-acetylmuramoyl-tripeptide--D-alanyl-D-alanine ligase